MASKERMVMEEAPTKEDGMGIPLRLLLVEDCDVDALLMVQAVRQAGYFPAVERVQSGSAMRTALGKPWDLIIADYTMPEFSGMDALSVRNIYAADTPFILVSGQISVEVAVETLKAGAQDYVSKNQLGRLGMAVQRALKEAEIRRERKRLQEQVSQAQKMEAVGQLAGGVAHDFNNILQIILGYTEVMLANFAGEEGRRNGLEQIHQSALRAAELTGQLLSFSRQQMISPSVLDLNVIIGGMRIMIERLMGEGIPVTIRLADGAGRIYADSGQIEQALINLVLNAREAMPEGGHLEIETRSVELHEDEACRMMEARPGRFATVTVTDTGVGMDPALIARIFEPFFSTKGLGKAAGLGLSVTYGIARQHNGWIVVNSQVGGGSSFTLYFPVYEGAHAVQIAGMPEAVPPVGKGERILLVEDEQEVRRLTIRVLSAAGYEVMAAASIQEGLDLFEREKGAFNLVFSDVVLPDGNGVDLVEKVLVQKPDVAILLSSGYVDDRLRWKAIERRGFLFLAKPHLPNVLLRAVRAALDSSTLVPS